MITDPTLLRIGEGVALHHHRGRPAAARTGVALPVAGLYPSLHLNLGECYRKLGDLGRARGCLHRAQAGIGALGDDEYGQLIRAGLDRLARELTEQ